MKPLQGQFGEIEDKNIWVSDQGDGTFINPVLYTDYSDPDVIRVGADFYMVASSFCDSPGLPVLHSKDLVNWKVISYVVDRIPFSGYETPAHGRGVWAPSIRYHDSKFWVYFGMPDEGIFMSNTEDPFGTWAPLTCVKKVKGWIDTCPLWDEDGNAYLVNGFAKSRIGFKSVLAISKMKSDGTELLDEFRIAFDGNINHPTIEGPKFYKRNGYYYIFAPAGGVATGWQVVLRSKHVYGPYEEKIVLHQGNTTVNGPHQGGWVELESGESWFVHFQDVEACGRIVHMQPMQWVDDWPVMGEDINGDGIGEPVLRWKKPDVGRTYPIQIPAMTDFFDAEKIGLQWQWQANYKEKWYSLTERKEYLRLYASHDFQVQDTFLWNAPNVLMQKFPGPEFTVTTKLEFHPKYVGEKAGLVIMGHQYSYLSLEKKEDGLWLAQVKGYGSENPEGEHNEKEVAGIALDTNTIYLRVSVQKDDTYSFHYSLDGDTFCSFGESAAATPGRWVGAKVGIFCIGEQKREQTGHADFAYFAFHKDVTKL